MIYIRGKTLAAIAFYCFISTTVEARGPSNYDRKVDSEYFQSHRKPKPRLHPCPPPCEEIPVIEVYEFGIQEIYGSGELIQLDDGSLWRVYEGDRDLIGSWARSDRVEVLQTDDQRFPYRLTNCSSRKTVRAQRKADGKIRD